MATPEPRDESPSEASVMTEVRETQDLAAETPAENHGSKDHSIAGESYRKSLRNIQQQFLAQINNKPDEIDSPEVIMVDSENESVVSDDEERAAREEVKSLEARLAIKRNEGVPVTIDEEILLERQMRQEAMRRRRRQRERQARNIEDSLFVPDFSNDESKGTAPSFQPSGNDSTDVFSHVETLTRKSGRANVKRKRSPGSAMNPIEDENPHPRKRPVKTEKQFEKKGLQVQSNLSRLVSSNLFEDVETTQHKPGLPELPGSRRQETMSKFIASLPQAQKKSAMEDKKTLDEACKMFKKGTLKKNENDGSFNLSGLRVSLKPHQVIGAGWMRRRELEDIDTPGGILADAMGFGKTIMSLSNILDSKSYRGPRSTTLIVAPVALALQWYAEILKHCVPEKIGRVLKYFGTSRILSTDPSILLDFDVVITTYPEVRKSYPKGEVPPNLQTSLEKDEWWRGFYEEEAGLLHKIDFHRIIIDECQLIKNHESITSMAVRALRGRHRWALSGTPIANNILELYPLFRFLGVDYTGTFNTFRKNYFGVSKQPTTQAIDRLQVLLSKYMLRRTLKDELFGFPLLKLPESRVKTVYIQFNPLERALYDIVLQRMVEGINKMSTNGDIRKRRSNMLTQQLRLRMMTSHVFLIQETLEDSLLEAEDFEKIRVLTQLKANVVNYPNQVQKLRKLLAEYNPNQQTGLGGHHGVRSPESDPLLTGLCNGQAWKHAQTQMQCFKCGSKPVRPWITSCYHIYCESCLKEVQISAAQTGLGDMASCLACGAKWTDAHEIESATFEAPQGQEYNYRTRGSDGDEPDINQHPYKRRGKKKKNDEDWIATSDGILPSPKTVALKAQVLNWIQEDNSVKIIVFTQFIDMIRIVVKLCQEEEGWPCVTYHGGKTQEQRAGALERFSTDPGVRILVASLKAGGIGLNLTAASRVIILEPWFNDTVDHQAYSRIYRIGQNRETRLVRFIVANTVDEKLMQMQERKRKTIEIVIDGKRKELTDEELMGLFGDAEKDEQGNTFIHVEKRDVRLNPCEDRSFGTFHNEI